MNIQPTLINTQPNLISDSIIQELTSKPINYYQVPINNNRLQLICVLTLVVLFCCFCYSTRPNKNVQSESEINPDLDSIINPESQVNLPNKRINNTNISNQEHYNNHQNIEYFLSNNTEKKHILPKQVNNYIQEEQVPEIMTHVNDVIKNDRLDNSIDIHPNRQLSEIQYPNTNFNNNININQESINPVDIMKHHNSPNSIKELTHSQMESIREEQDSLIRNNLQNTPDPTYNIEQQHTNRKDIRNDSHTINNDSPIEKIQTEVTNENMFNNFASFQNADTTASFSFI